MAGEQVQRKLEFDGTPNKTNERTHGGIAVEAQETIN
jgi:hypothetical protein